MEFLTPCKAAGSGAMYRNRKLLLCLPLPSHKKPVSTKLQWHLNRGTMWLQSRAILVRFKGHSKYQIRKKVKEQHKTLQSVVRMGFPPTGRRRDEISCSRVMCCLKEENNGPGRQQTLPTHPAAHTMPGNIQVPVAKKCFNSLMSGKRLLSSTVRGFCLHKVSSVWV